MYQVIITDNRRDISKEGEETWSYCYGPFQTMSEAIIWKEENKWAFAGRLFAINRVGLISPVTGESD